MADMMKALRYIGPGNVALLDVPRPLPGDGEVLLRVGAAGICHSDVHVARGTSSLSQLDDLAPFTLGHEIAGVVVATGSHAAPDLRGMRAAVYAPTGCLDCASCTEGAWNYCDARDEASIPGLGLGQDGGLAEYVAVDARRLIDIHDLPFELAAISTDAALTSVHAISTHPSGCCVGQHRRRHRGGGTGPYRGADPGAPGLPGDRGRQPGQRQADRHRFRRSGLLLAGPTLQV